MSHAYSLAEDGIFEAETAVQHRDDEYPEERFSTLLAMQERHFWYRGRHRFLLRAVDRYCSRYGFPSRAVDLGGGVGGWVSYLAKRRREEYQPLALADSSRRALQMAGDVLPHGIERYQIDLMNLGWENHWDVAFLLDVIEHLPGDTEALRNARAALKPGGLLFVTVPAFQWLWSYNDDLARHLRRYTRNELSQIATEVNLEVLDVRYFMFLLSPMYLLARKSFGIRKLNDDQICRLRKKMHAVPPNPWNFALATVFALETPIGHLVRFPWGTSVFGVFRKPKP